MKLFHLSWMLMLCAAHAGAVEIHSPKASQTSLTVYRPSLASGVGLFDMSDPYAKAGGIALVSEVREVDLPAGEFTLVFDNVAQTLVPQSARIDFLSGMVAEVNFDYSLITPGDIIAHSIGESVTLVRTDAATGKVTEESALLTSGPDGVLLNINGHFEALDCSGEHEKIIFHSIPPSLTATPHLSAKLRVHKAGKQRLKLSYLATGFDWRAQYIARVNPEGNYLSLTGWVTLVNQQTTSFYNAPVDVVAGEISIDEETKPVNFRALAKSNACWYVRRTAAAPAMQRMMSAIGYAKGSTELEEVIVTGFSAYIAEQHELGDYKLYRLPAPTDVLGQQIKQVKMLDEPKVAFEKIYFVSVDDDSFFSRITDDDVAVVQEASRMVVSKASIRVQNQKAMGLGKPVPAGGISVMGSNGIGGSPLLIGEDEVRDTPTNTSFDVVLGDADGIDVYPVVEREYTEERGGNQSDRSDLVVEVFNHKSEAITFELRLPPPLLDDYRVVKESKKHHFKDGSLVWALKIPAGKRAKLSFTMEEVY